MAVSTVATTTKLNKTQKFNAIQKLLADNGITELSVDGVAFNVNDFIDKEKENIAKKSANAKAKKSVDNSAFEVAIRDALANGPMSASEIMSKCGMPNTQKVTAVLAGMSDVTRTQVGKKVTFSI